MAVSDPAGQAVRADSGVSRSNRRCSAAATPISGANAGPPGVAPSRQGVLLPRDRWREAWGERGGVHAQPGGWSAIRWAAACSTPKSRSPGRGRSATRDARHGRPRPVNGHWKWHTAPRSPWRERSDRSGAGEWADPFGTPPAERSRAELAKASVRSSHPCALRPRKAPGGTCRSGCLRKQLADRNLAATCELHQGRMGQCRPDNRILPLGLPASDG